MTQPWVSQGVWRTVQFFLDSETGDSDEVSWQTGTRALRCTCNLAMCMHIAMVRSRMNAQGNIPVDLGLGADDEVMRLGLDVSDPGVLRDLLRRYGHIVVL